MDDIDGRRKGKIVAGVTDDERLRGKRVSRSVHCLRQLDDSEARALQSASPYMCIMFQTPILRENYICHCPPSRVVVHHMLR